MACCNPNPQIGVIDFHERTKALELVFGFLPPEERVPNIVEVSFHRRGSVLDLWSGLIGVHSNGKLIGAMFSRLIGGRTASLWLPRFRGKENSFHAADLFGRTWSLLEKHGVHTVQVSLPKVDAFEAEMLAIGKFSHLTDLDCLIGMEDTFCANVPKSPFQFQPYSVARHQDWIKILTDVNRNTMDCAKLGDLWDPEDFLDACRSSSEGRDDLWFLANVGNRAAGCLLLADHPRQNRLELLYLGLVPEWRGRGLGKILVSHARHLARRLRRRQVAVAVDQKNPPARKTYEALGFRRCGRRTVFSRNFFSR